MSKRPWHKRYHSDALTGYRSLSLELRGAYTTILDLLYDSDEEALPSNERWMAGQLDVSARKWRLIREELSEARKIIVLPDGRITNNRYLRERAKDAALSKERAAAGRKGGLANADQGDLGLENDAEKVAKTGEFDQFSTPENATSHQDNSDEQSENSNEINDGTEAIASGLPLYARANQIPESRDQSIESPLDSLERPRDAAPPPDLWSGDVLPATQALCDRAGISLVQPTALPRNLDMVKKWRADGIDIEAHVIPAIDKQVADRPNDPVWSLAYFDANARRARSNAERRRGRATRSDAAPPEPLKAKDQDDPRIAKIRGAVKGNSDLLPEIAAFSINGVGLIVTCRSAWYANRIRNDSGDQLRDLAKRFIGRPDIEVRTQ